MLKYNQYYKLILTRKYLVRRSSILNLSPKYKLILSKKMCVYCIKIQTNYKLVHFVYKLYPSVILQSHKP